MRLTRPRFTVRHLMIAVAVVAMVLGVDTELRRRRDRFYGIAMEHGRRIDGTFAGPAVEMRAVNRKKLHHVSMQSKYLRASRFPFLPVPSDPPLPE